MSEDFMLNPADRVSLALGQAAQARKSLEALGIHNSRLQLETAALKKRLGESEDTSDSLPWAVDLDEVRRKQAAKVFQRPVSELDWHDFDVVRAVHGEDEDARLWNRIMDETRLGLETGDDAARMVRDSGKPAEHARFHLIRQSLLDEWSPRPGTETMIVDMLVQTRHVYETWLQRHGIESSSECQYLAPSERDQAKYGKWFPPRISEFESIQLSAMMVTRFQNQFIKLVRALRDLRRMSPSLVIRNAAQVNVGQQQVNLQAES